MNIPSTDLDRSSEFYLDQLGLPELPRPAVRIAGRLGGRRAGKTQSTSAGYPRLGPNPNNHFALEVEDLEGLLDRLEARGVAFHRSAHVPAAGRQAFLSDPDGNVIELNQPPA